MTLQRLLNIDLPLIQAPMAGVQLHGLTAAVSNAGALGSLPGAMLDAAWLRHELTTLKSKTKRPYNLNFFCHQPPAPDEQREALWRSVLAPYYQELGIDAQQILPAPSRQPFSHEMADLVTEFQPAVVSFHFGLPSAELLARVKASGAKVLSSATTVEEAVWLQQHGADAIIAQGLEAGGHRGMFLSAELTSQLGTFALLPQIVAAVQLPVIAAGGIADAQGIRAAMALGASGVQLGTAFLCTHEASTSAIHRAALHSPAAAHTAVTNLFSGRPARGIVNRIIRELGPISAHAPAFPLATGAIAPLRSKGESLGHGDFSPLWAGQNVSGCKDIGAAELVAELALGFTH
ncbi:NAD(P)H-dependent flavin oxidoreductase [Pseudomonas sp. 5P_3.1_Bac2]|uniref:NAD(P)H-dependent flavin oxidoreductase n=1 Tax=Pseudomonas sp. 5P_3.1_Bac2 TaxID=2971617 RepID=UPI0021C861C9|nr:nitronate monooxygenase [Pseudomonas sp. 5P_3.1_Bac2]MCU1718359.1 nitronate monooxygenase [Pseudomonas sp. 5P_3.1_Bac2]